MFAQPLTLSPIGIVHSPYKEKFSVPRQPNLVQDGVGTLNLLPPYNQPEAVRGLEAFSHLWLIFQFDKIPQGKWQPTVRPPRLGGNQRVGVFASRATHRPNPLGLSKVALRNIEIDKGEVLLHLGALDLVDGTPIFDIKPYIAYADSEPNACSSFAQQAPEKTLTVVFSLQAMCELKKCGEKRPHFQRFITEVLQQDPRPAYHQNSQAERIYGMRLYDFNIRWQVRGELVEVLELERV
ncbi:tRNA (N6-threonylcarbamoyladenosine(37)-N6)-methyltransferase TrmO [Avibacterium paragallinarum]|uniref:tRNA (N6-threonylcarbamoyladenosine(37)-N6)-methyltransferase TrmO n=1 Tax=Avibacterium paragallinarum TaxID=728 RepID=A0AAE5THR1_AVIPA|nr:tRNA (N6-threonylcarbamoyladenosine(37)-N6)-methyltransferase TrmO [Avibacterium paragallinarum]MEE3608788.1 tRNA (N6-threonylcarbamoyladenosine(37)-N6)-methyltransferase TrmO [Avibacterium paragallinarum]MEE3620161.1 tRNA (N6-threonylcarbamoyladenosine(37)-N6)-methyltransferase TrmO [Avibacterium paragallinarum]MEE3668156.1 tRNA (N6-threonylcarbamoyladenosine(37)-N6)-methyltransferase TrmO [Avibacterium paragallinarum]MEE3680990.1 tRNA (N6-threonylcarbamoyladenosine(37)-N6)-methyltransferas